MKRPNEVSVRELPTCSFCPLAAKFDGATVFGPWAYMCEEHFAAHGIGLGVGVGQRLVLVETHKQRPVAGGAVLGYNKEIR